MHLIIRIKHNQYYIILSTNDQIYTWGDNEGPLQQLLPLP